MEEVTLTKSEQTNADIIKAALELFIAQGYHGTSMRQIATKANIALGSIYNHFPSKADVFRGVLLEYHPVSKILASLEEAQGDSIEAFLRDTAQRMLQTLAQSPGLLHLVFIEMIEFNNIHLEEIYRQFFPQAMQVAQYLYQWNDQLRPIPLPIIIRSFFGLFFSYYITDLLIAPFATAEFHENALNYFLDIYLHGILKKGKENA